MLNTMVKFKMASLPVLLAKQEVPAGSCLHLIDLYRLDKKRVSWDGTQNGEV